MGTPSNQEQLALEYINLLRTDPAGEYARLVGVQANIDSTMAYFGVDLAALQSQLNALTPAAPLAWNSIIADVAEAHSQAMIDADQQSHELPGEGSLGSRLDAAGYANKIAWGENVYAYADDDLYGHAGFVVDWGYDAGEYNFTTGMPVANFATMGDGIQDPAGHRNSMMSTNFTEVGIDITQETNSSTQVGEYVITQDFGNRAGYQAQFVGVVIDDQDGDAFYDIGEGLGGVSVALSDGTNTYNTVTWASGGWQVEVPAGTYTLTFSGGALTGVITKSATLGSNNVKVDALAAEAASNTAPVVAVDNQSVAAGQSINFNSIAAISDADGNAITQYRLFDADGGNNWYADGALVDASASGGYVTSNLAGVSIHGDASAGSQTLWVQVFDGTDWSAWDSFALTTVNANTAPTINVSNQTVGTDVWTKLNTVASVNDADGDTVSQFTIWDSVGGNNWWADGGYVDASSGYVTNDLSSVWFQGDSSASSQTLWVRANDGTEWGSWDSFSLTTTVSNSAPTVAIDTQSVAQNAWSRLSTFATFNDADDDAITQYEVWDSVGDNSWWADGGHVDASGGYTTSNLSGIWVQGDDTASTQKLWVRAYDGTEWGAWDSFDLITG